MADAAGTDRTEVDPAAVAEAAASPPLSSAAIPRATYRVQLHAGFGFNDAAAIVPYLQALGFSHLYCSPYLKARAGSMHGYDIVDHNALNPEIGSEADFERLCRVLRDHGMQQLVDIVPNHMGVMQSDNAWWLDVLENGPASAQAQTFDIDWTPTSDDKPGQVLLPTLGGQYGDVLEAGELKLAFDASRGDFSVFYYENRFPIDPIDAGVILRAAPWPEAAAPAGIEAAAALVERFAALPAREDPRSSERERRANDIRQLKQSLIELHANHAWVGRWIEAAVNVYNGRVGEPSSFDALDGLIRRQAWRAAYWRAAGDEINYRRFFDVSTLAALRMEREDVFEATHRTLLRWLAEGKIAGLRIDHPDGLADPAQYFRRLQQRHVDAQLDAGVAAPAALYLVIEKILAPHEHWPESWPVHGDTGYRFVNLVNGVFVDARNAEAFDQLYARFIGPSHAALLDYEEQLHEAKHRVMVQALAADLHMLTEAAYRLAQADRHTRDFTRNGLKAALAELAAAFPVYRTYIGTVVDDAGGQAIDRQHLDWALAAAKRRRGAAEDSALDHLHRLMLGAPDEPDTARRAERLHFTRRFQQFTSPVMAKAMEDTVFYRYQRLVSLNEVGGEPRQFGVGIAAFHGANQTRQRFLPATLLATSTHDTKRAEDVRARINVLSELPQAWSDAVTRWQELNRRNAERRAGVAPIDANTELLLYQTLIGVWPMGGIDADALAALRQRIQAYMLKATREAKVETSWTHPDADYEATLASFIDLLLGTLEPNPFLTDFRAFVERLLPYGCCNSLVQVALKLTVPGVPDVYQGCETWDLSLVDPDNRRPVDHAALAAQLKAIEVERAEAAASETMPSWLAGLRASLPDGRMKLYATWRLLDLRQRRPAVFVSGRYMPLVLSGPVEDHVIGFLREGGDAASVCLVVASRFLFTLTAGQPEELFVGGVWQGRWRGTALQLPASAPRQWVDVVSGRRIAAADGDADTATLSLGELFADLPFAVLEPAAMNAV